MWTLRVFLVRSQTEMKNMLLETERKMNDPYCKVTKRLTKLCLFLRFVEGRTCK